MYYCINSLLLLLQLPIVLGQIVYKKLAVKKNLKIIYTEKILCLLLLNHRFEVIIEISEILC